MLNVTYWFSHTNMNNTPLIVPFCLLLASCGGLTKQTDAVKLPGAQSVTLSMAAKKLVSDGVREMVAKETVNGGEGAKIGGFTAFRLPPKTGIHVCGDVSYQLEPGKPTVSAPYYLEFSDQGGKLEATRGQVGFDKLKKSKVKFMCRHKNAG